VESARNDAFSWATTSVGIQCLVHSRAGGPLPCCTASGEPVADLGGDHPVVALLVDRAADERFSQMVAVALGGVDQVHAELPRASEQPVHLRFG
jgi:hypothetical protein